MPKSLDNIESGIVGMYAAIKIFRHNGIDPHAMVDAIVAENPCWKIVKAEVALGNAVVPQVAQWIGERIMEVHRAALESQP